MRRYDWTPKTIPIKHQTSAGIWKTRGSNLPKCRFNPSLPNTKREDRCLDPQTPPEKSLRASKHLLIRYDWRILEGQIPPSLKVRMLIFFPWKKTRQPTDLETSKKSQPTCAEPSCNLAVISQRLNKLPSLKTNRSRTLKSMWKTILYNSICRGYNSIYRSYNSIYPFIRVIIPYIEVITSVIVTHL